MIAHNLRVDDIEIGERHRALSADAVIRLAASMKDIGLKQPVSVRLFEEMIVDGELTAGVPVLVAGAHRLAAAKSLGWSHIDCIEVEDDAITAELWELAENLHRHDLTKEQRDEHIRRYAELLTARRALVKPDKPSDFKDAGAGRGNKGVAAEISESTGISQRTVRRAMNPAPKLIRVADPPLDPEDAYNRWARQMSRVWGSASLEWRARWASENGEFSIMDERHG